jgi:hypothetical protein
MADFKEKGIFLWCYWDISFDVRVVADKIIEGGFEAVYVHTNDGYFEGSYGRLENGRYVDHLNCTDELVAELRSRGLKIYGWGAPYGVNTTAEIAMMVKQTKRYKLDGYIIDAEGTWDVQSDVIADTRKIITEYKAQCPGVPVAWCWWALWHVPGKASLYHSPAVLQEAMKYADYGMPMAYWNWITDPTGVRYLEETVKQWREITGKPLIIAGRAYNDAYGQASYAAVKAFDQRARELGSIGITWWDAQHAVKLPECWRALIETEKFNKDEEPAMALPIGLFTRKAGWTAVNPGFNFVAGAAQAKDTVQPNPNIKPIELEAIAGKIPMLLWWDHLPWPYSEEQWGELNWPDEAHDYIWQNFKAILGARTYQAVVVSVNTYKSRAGKDEDPAFVAYSAKRFMDRVGGWLKANRPAIPLILASSNDFISRHAPNINNWAGNFPSLAVQPAALSGSYPVDGAKPAYLGNSSECEWWRYYEMAAADQALLVFRGANGYPASVDGMSKWLNLSQPVPDTTPPSVPVGLASSVGGSSVVLTWMPSTDAVGVVGYQVYRDGAKLMATTGITASFGSVTPGTYVYGVAAFDAAGNESQPATISVTVRGATTETITRAEFDALIARVAALESRKHTHSIGEA